MTELTKLFWVKILHTLIWVYFNLVLIYLFFAGITDRIDGWVWFGIGSFAAEGMVLLIFKNVCPLTLWARNYSNSSRDNFDIFIPNWIAKHNKAIYTILLVIALAFIAYRMIF
ncbi:MAG: hypothetical protein AB7K37_13975 [Cyclobacteriaceae bacterium]